MKALRATLSHRLLGTTLESWLIAAAVALTVLLVLTAVRRVALRRATQWSERTATRVDDVLVALLASLKHLFFLAVGLWIAAELVDLSAAATHLARTSVTLLALVQIGLSLKAVIAKLARGFAQGDVDGEAKTAASATAFLANLAVWTVLFVSGLSVLGFKISALVAGLGVGGVAAALAVQSILSDLFASLSIYFDRPFHLGDFIITGDELGTVERIGLRSTRVRSLGGEEIVFANSDLTKSRIRNYKRMKERRVVFGMGVQYDTTLEQLQAIPGLIRAIIEAEPDTRFDRAHFKEFGEFALNFEAVFYVLSPDYNLYMDRQQAINLKLFAEFAQRGIQFAVTTQKLQLMRASTSSKPESANMT
jgi:small-conductance mechanosensitive channel